MNKELYKKAIETVRDYYQNMASHKAILESNRAKYKGEYLRQAELTFQGQSLSEKDAVQESFARLKADFSEEVSAIRNPMKWKYSEKLLNILNSPVRFSESDYHTLMSSADSFADQRLISGRAFRDGFIIELPSASEEIDRFNWFIDECGKVVNAGYDDQPRMLETCYEGLEEYAAGAGDDRKFSIHKMDSSGSMESRFREMGQRVWKDMSDEQNTGASHELTEAEAKAFVQSLNDPDAENVLQQRYLYKEMRKHLAELEESQKARLEKLKAEKAAKAEAADPEG